MPEELLVIICVREGKVEAVVTGNDGDHIPIVVVDYDCPFEGLDLVSDEKCDIFYPDVVHDEDFISEVMLTI